MRLLPTSLIVSYDDGHRLSGEDRQAALLLGCLLAASGAAQAYGLAGRLMQGSILLIALLFGILFVAMLSIGATILHHAEHVAARLREPVGTVLVTLSVNVIEVFSISAVVLHGANNPTLLRDSLLAGIMLVLNGMVGLSLLVGGWHHREQSFNLQGANSFLSVLLPLSIISLILPGFTDSASGAIVSDKQMAFLMAMTMGLYIVFVLLQTGRHREYFTESMNVAAAPVGTPVDAAPWIFHAGMLAAAISVAVLLALQISVPLDYGIETLHLPVALGGMIIAFLVALPEGCGALRAARDNRLQSAINILLGSSLSTFGITVPAVLAIGLLSGRGVELGLHGINAVMLCLTLLASIITFVSGRTSVLQGAVHLLILAAFVILSFQA